MTKQSSSKAPAATKSTAARKSIKDLVFDTAVSTMDPDGYGLAQYENKQVLISGALPGELIRAQITAVGNRTHFAKTVKVLRRSPHRLASSPCSNHFCDGCPLVTLSYSAQLAWKQSRVNDVVAGYSSLACAEVNEVVPSTPRLGYRNTAKLVVGGKHSNPVIGIYRRNSHDIIDISECPLHHPLINRVVAAVKEGIRKGKVPVYSPRSRSGLLRYLVVRVAPHENQAMVTFVTAERGLNAVHHLAKAVHSSVPEVSVVAENINSSPGNVILGSRTVYLTRDHSLTASIGSVRFTLSPHSFFQVNTGGAESIYETVRAWAGLTGRERVIDLYCGVGGLSLYLAGQAREVLGIEMVEAAVLDAAENARINGRENCRFVSGDAAEHMASLRRNHYKADLVVLNPPRKGCEESVLRTVAELSPPRIIYVSCSPESLARDLDILSEKGYRTVRIQPVDMFPQTPHVENIALVEKR